MASHAFGEQKEFVGLLSGNSCFQIMIRSSTGRPENLPKADLVSCKVDMFWGRCSRRDREMMVVPCRSQLYAEVENNPA